MPIQFPSREQTDRDNALPPASILEKLQNRVPDAGVEILNKMNKFSQEENPGDNRERSLVNMFKSKAFWDGFTDAITLAPLFAPGLRHDRRTAHHNIYDQSWITVGNRMRRAIVEVMAEHNLSGRDIGLTQQERRALAPLPYSRQDMRYSA